jgi:hypothetical protein
MRSSALSNKTFGESQIMLGMSTFDVVGAIAWGLSTAPIPVYNKYGDPSSMYGAVGNPASCKTQGFFIQLSFTSIFYNVTLSAYYLLGKKLPGRKCIDQSNRFFTNSLFSSSHCERLA